MEYLLIAIGTAFSIFATYTNNILLGCLSIIVTSIFACYQLWEQSPLKHEFLASDLEGQKKINISANRHRKHPPDVKVYRNSGSGYVEVHCMVSIEKDDSVNISAGVPFDGRIVIK